MSSIMPISQPTEKLPFPWPADLPANPLLSLSAEQIAQSIIPLVAEAIELTPEADMVCVNFEYGCLMTEKDKFYAMKKILIDALPGTWVVPMHNMQTCMFVICFDRQWCQGA